jgi:hypothetical protein
MMLATSGRNNVALTTKTIVQMAISFFMKAVSDPNGTHYEADNGIGTPMPLSPDNGDDDDDN